MVHARDLISTMLTVAVIAGIGTPPVGATDELIHVATAVGDTDWVKALVRSGADVNAKGNHGYTALHYAAANGDLVITQVLLQAGADFNACDNQGRSPLDVASAFTREQLVSLYAGKNTSFRIDGPIRERQEDSTPLHQVVREPNARAKARILIAQGARLDAVDDGGCQPLHRAAEVGRDEIVKMLLELGADAQARDRYARTPLFYAVTGPHIQATRTLLASGASPRDRNDAGETPLHVARDRMVAQALLDAGAEVDSRDARGATPLAVAAAASHLGLVEFLIGRGADVNTSDRHGLTPLHTAALLGNDELLTFLLGHGAHRDVRDDKARSPEDLARVKNQVHVLALLKGRQAAPSTCAALIRSAAAQRDLVSVMKLVREDPAAVNAHDGKGFTPLHLCAAKGDATAVMECIRYGGSVSTVDHEGKTPLHVVVGRQAAELLLDGGADVNAKDRRRETPLHAAALSGKYDVIPLLLARGADRKAKDSLGKTPSDGAARIWDRRALALLANDVLSSNTRSQAPDPREAEQELLAAVGRGDVIAAREALKKGASVNCRSPEGETPLDVANRCGRVQLAQILQGTGGLRGVDLDSGSDCPGSVAALLDAAKAEDVEAIRVQLAKGVPVDAADDQGLTALHIAATFGKRLAVLTLIDSGADLNAVTRTGATPLHKSVQRGHLEVTELLLDRGADPKVRDGQGHTPLDVARQRAHKELVKLLKGR